MMPGAYTPFAPVSEKDVVRFKEKLGPLKGVNYEPLLVAVQESVNPSNYLYICNATSVTNPPRDFLAAVEFLNDGTTIIKELDLHKEVLEMIPGAYAPFAPVTEKDIIRFEEKLGSIEGVIYKPLLVAVQGSVNPPNYLYICNATSVTNPTRDYLAAVEFLNDGTTKIKELDLHEEVLKMIPGAYTPFAPVTEEDVIRFQEKLGLLFGAGYEPLLVAVQSSVNPPNYLYICNAALVTNPPKDFLAAVEFFNNGTMKIKELNLY